MTIVEHLFTPVKHRDSNLFMFESELILTQFIAFAVPGQGINCEVEYSARSEVSEVQLRKHLSEVLAKIDHKTVGMDVRIEGRSTATLSEIADWLFADLRLRVPQSKSLILRFGNGLTCTVKAPAMN